MILVLLAARRTPECAASDHVLIQPGELPIVISAPHGGTGKLDGVPVRSGISVPSGPSGFVTVRDSSTDLLALELSRRLEEEFGARPWHVVSQVHRRYVDFNRSLEIAVEHPRARVVYDQYHDALKDACREIRATHQHGLLLDLHGQGTAPDTIFRGTRNGRTVAGLRKRFGDEAHHGPGSFFGLLQKSGWKVHPSPFDGKERSGYTGGYIVTTYGSHRPAGIDAIQLEFGSEYRLHGKHRETADKLTRVIADWVSSYLPELMPATSSAVTDH